MRSETSFHMSCQNSGHSFYIRSADLKRHFQANLRSEQENKSSQINIQVYHQIIHCKGYIMIRYSPLLIPDLFLLNLQGET